MLFYFPLLVCLLCQPIYGDNFLSRMFGVKRPRSDMNRDAMQLIESRGFRAEAHFVTTSDGYILGVHRIVNPLVNKTKPNPVILQHGFLASSIDFLINAEGGNFDEEVTLEGPVGNNLGFELSKRGYDVWLPNSRGNTYSRNHTYLNPNKDKEYWKFCFDHKIMYDLPATIDYIRGATGSATVRYVGHSQGTMIMFGLLSSQPKYNDIVKPFIALAPITSVGGIKTPVKYLANSYLLHKYVTTTGGAFLSNSIVNKLLAHMFCPSAFRWVCSNAVFLLAGFSPNQFNMTRMPIYMKNTPAGSSAQNLQHFAQGVISKKFQMYDFSSKFENKRVYGSYTPPEYRLQAITSPNIALITADNDWLADSEDLAILRKKLKVPLLDDYKVPVKEWNHLDFIWAIDAGKYVNRKVIDLLAKF